MWGRAIILTSLNPGRLLEVLLRILVDYRHDGKAFDARYKGGCSGYKLTTTGL